MFIENIFRIFDPSYNGHIRFTDLLIAFSMSMKGTGKIQAVVENLIRVLTFWCQNIIQAQPSPGLNKRTKNKLMPQYWRNKSPFLVSSCHAVCNISPQDLLLYLLMFKNVCCWPVANYQKSWLLNLRRIISLCNYK